MARRQRRASGKKNGQGKSHPHGLKEAIQKHLPPQFFAQWKWASNITWTVQRIFWMGLLMSWSAEQTLAARCEAVCAVLKKLFPKWTLGCCYTGWYDAQAKWIEPLKPALSRRLQQQIQAMARKQWTREGWCAFAVDGSRVECPRTEANELKGTTSWVSPPSSNRPGIPTSSRNRRGRDLSFRLAGRPFPTWRDVSDSDGRMTRR